MLTPSEINAFVEDGYLIRKNALSPTNIQSYRSAIDRILHKCRIEGLHAEHLRYIDSERDDIWGVNNIFHLSIRERTLVDALAHPQILDVMEALIGKRLRYHLCTLLVNSERKPYHIRWHRDTAVDGEIPLERLLSGIRSHVQLNGALYDDETLCIVPGSHRRELTDTERTVLQETPMAEMPNQLVVKLKTGDIVFYNSRIIHKGCNHLTGAKRQTLHYAVLVAPPEGTPPNNKDVESQTWLNEPDFLGSLTSRLKPLFDNWLKYG